MPAGSGAFGAGQRQARLQAADQVRVGDVVAGEGHCVALAGRYRRAGAGTVEAVVEDQPAGKVLTPKGEGVDVGNRRAHHVQVGQAYEGVLIGNMGYSPLEAASAVEAGQLDAVAFGVPFLANPDLPARIKAGAQLNAADPGTFYSGGAAGYTDYPFMQ